MSKPLRLHYDDALLLGRCSFAGLLLLFGAIKSPRALADLGRDHFHPPLGPFALLDSYPPLWLVIALESLTFLLLAVWVTGRGRWIVGLALTLALVTLSGFVYSAGKIDHDFVVLLVPLLLTLPRPAPQGAILFCLATYFASSGLAKAIGGWLDLHTQASLSWALLYAHGYGKTELLLEWRLRHLPGWSWEIFDQVTVWFELLVPLALLPRLRLPIALAVPLFHLGALLFFGIDFTRLFLVYLPLALLALAERPGPGPTMQPIPPRTRFILQAALVAGILASGLHLLIHGHFWTLPFPVHPPGLLLFTLFAAALLFASIQRPARSRRAAP